MKNAILVLFTMLAVACHSSKHIAATPAGGDAAEGTSYSNPVVIQEKTEKKGVDAEYAWIRQHYPGSRVGGQALTQKDGKPFDILPVTTAEGKKLQVYFDISNYFGKW